MATVTASFFRLWQVENVRSTLEEHLDRNSLCALRLTSTACCNLATPPLFVRTRLTFTSTALTKPSRVEALSRIGHHIEHLTFLMPHSSATFLPPLLNPQTGKEVVFLYTPHTSLASQTERPKYGSSELGDILTLQYPPLFHAATNVPAFIQAIAQMPNLRHLTISCPGQDPTLRYRRDCVDYALTSLRIAVEQARLPKLEKLSLHPIHASGLHYLRYMPGFGSSPVGARRWGQIRKLNISLEAWDFYGPSPCLDHLKILDDFIRSFSGKLEKLRFTWVGPRGPCPFSLALDPLFAPPRKTSKLFGEVTSLNSPLPAAPIRKPIRFTKLRYIQLRNASMATSQVSSFIYDHQESVKEFDFENVLLSDEGSWEDALSPLTRSESWRSHHTTSSDDDSYRTCPSKSSLEFLSDDSFPEVIDEVRQPIPVTKLKKRRKVRRRKHHGEVSAKGEELPLGLSPLKRSPFEQSPRKPEQMMPIPPLHPHVVQLPQRPPSHEENWPLPAGSPNSPLRPLQSMVSLHLSEAAASSMDISPPMLKPTIFNPDASIQGVQRNMQHDEEMINLTYDTDHRNTTLRKAKEAVLTKLGTQFNKKCEKKPGRGLAHRLRTDSRTELVPLMYFS